MLWKLDKWWKKTIYVIGILSIIWWILSIPFGIITTWGTAFTENMQQQETQQNILDLKDYQIECERAINNLTSEYQILYTTCSERINQCNQLLIGNK